MVEDVEDGSGCDSDGDEAPAAVAVENLTAEEKRQRAIEAMRAKRAGKKGKKGKKSKTPSSPSSFGTKRVRERNPSAKELDFSAGGPPVSF